MFFTLVRQMGQSCPKKVTNINTLDQLADNQRWGSDERGGEDRRKNRPLIFSENNNNNNNVCATQQVESVHGVRD